MFTKIYLLDTNILLQDATNLFNLSDHGQNLIVLPETVLDEIDSKKSGFDEINFQAREFARKLEEADVFKIETDDKLRVVHLKLIHNKHPIFVDILSKDRYACEDKTIAHNILNDRKILEVAHDLVQNGAKALTFLSLDIMARTRAISLGIPTQGLQGSYDANAPLQFVKKIALPFSALESLENSPITNYDTQYEKHNFCYEFKVIDSDQIILAGVQNKTIDLLDETELRNQDVTPLNKEQLFFAYAINRPSIDVVVVEAMAGSGKTLLALSGAIKLVRQKKQSNIIYIRNSIESLDKGEEVGFLPGLEDKFKIYNHPLMDSLEHIIRHKSKKQNQKNSTNSSLSGLSDQELEQKKQEMLERYNIQTMWVGEMRGRTLSQAVVIIDEAQNMSNKTMQMVLSRIDSSSKVIILGSNKQIDNFYVNRHTNALTTLLHSMNQTHEGISLFSLKLTKVLRGPITAWAETIFSKETNS